MSGTETQSNSLCATDECIHETIVEHPHTLQTDKNISLEEHGGMADAEIFFGSQLIMNR